MYLKTIKHLKLLNLLFRARTPSAEIYLNDLLLKRFSRVDKNTYKINPENILYLDQVWKNFKTEFSKFLGVSSPPFSFLLIKDFSEIHNLKILRTGKIYLEKPLKDKINSVLKNNKIFYKIKSWENLYELILPSTVDSKLEIFYKDVFWSGNKKFCFFCKTTWHNSSECLALLDPEPRKTFQSVLNLHFKELFQLLKSYLLFLKGYFYEYTGDSAIAEEFYKKCF